MYEVRNDCGTLISKHIGLDAAKLQCDLMHKKACDGSHYSVYKVEQVWTSQTLEEAINSK